MNKNTLKIILSEKEGERGLSRQYVKLVGGRKYFSLTCNFPTFRLIIDYKYFLFD